MKYPLTNDEQLEINTIVLDLNGTLTVHGVVPAGIPEQLKQLRDQGFKLVLLTGDVRGTAATIAKQLDLELMIAGSAEEKEAAMFKLNPSTCASIGNARIDIGTFKHAALSILTLQAEGVHVDALKYTDIIVPTINDALGLFLDPKALLATLRT